MTKRIYLLVSSFCVVEAIELLEKEGCVELGLSKQDNSWLLSFNLPIKKSSVDDSLTENCPVEEPDKSDITGPLCCQSCIKIKACKQMYVETGKWPEPHDCFVPDRVKKYPQFEMDSCEDCNVIHSCIARYDMDRTNWRCAKGKVHLNFTELHDAPQLAETSCEGDACHE